jgi:MerR family transcriptional regulator, thiopeptide resistance regulator
MEVRKGMKTYYVREFASLAGVTVRTLHYYDQTGLLKPARRVGGTHRLYQQRDLLRLQQILTLKELGFTLEEIRDLLERRGYNVQESLEIQKAAIDRRIEQLQRVSSALQVIMQAGGDYDWDTVIAAIRGLTASEESKAWLMGHYSDDQRELLQSRAATMTPDAIMHGVQMWADLGRDFQSLRHLSPDHPDVQRLAARMAALVEEFTQGDPAVLASLTSVYSDPDQMPMEYRPTDPDLFTFINEARRIYEERKST